MFGISFGLTFAVLPLYSLYRRELIARNPMRARIYQTIAQSPGVTIVQIAETVGLKHQSVAYHLQFLTRTGYVITVKRGNRRAHFAAGAGYDDEFRELTAVTNDPVSMQILSIVTEYPGIIKKDVAATLGLTRTGGVWHVNKLIRLGVLREKKGHGRCELFVVHEKLQRIGEIQRSPDEDVPVLRRVPIEVDVADETATSDLPR